jgi:isopentenyl-diphosphate delta-isomerase
MNGMQDSSNPFRTPENDGLNRRKQGHINACLDSGVDLGRDSFEQIKLRYNALPEVALDDVSTETDFAGRTIAAPLIISSMTGGVGDEFLRINRNLALGAETLKIPLGLGSMKVMLRDEAAADSFMIRDVAPSVPIIANLGLVSFNYGIGWDDVDRIVERVQPDVFGLHLNALQESIQEGGDTDFRGLKRRLEEFVVRSKLPVYVKECGGGIAPDLVETIARTGVQYIDISGNDGTSWARVEAALSRDQSLGELFGDFGLPTRWILERVRKDQMSEARLVASGGIRNGIQAVKAFAMGADFASVARPFLLAAMESPDAVVSTGRKLIREIRTAMFLVGAGSIGELDRTFLIDQVR